MEAFNYIVMIFTFINITERNFRYNFLFIYLKVLIKFYLIQIIISLIRKFGKIYFWLNFEWTLLFNSLIIIFFLFFNSFLFLKLYLITDSKNTIDYALEFSFLTLTTFFDNLSTFKFSGTYFYDIFTIKSFISSSFCINNGKHTFYAT